MVVVLCIATSSLLAATQKASVHDGSKKPAKKTVLQKSVNSNHSGEKDVKDIPADAQLLDNIAAVVFAQEGTQIITASELERKSLDGNIRTLDDLVYEKLMILDAQKFKIAPDEDQIDKHLESVQRENNLTLDQLKTIFTNAGYSYEEGREQFGIISLINQLLDFKIRSRLIVPEKEVVAYYNANPEKEDARYLIQRGYVPYATTKERDEQREDIENFVHGRNGFVSIEWQEPFWIEKNEIAQDKEFIMRMQAGDISSPVATEDGFELFKLKDFAPERLKTMDERYREISDILRRPKHEQLLNEYKKQLMENSSVLYLS